MFLGRLNKIGKIKKGWGGGAKLVKNLSLIWGAVPKIWDTLQDFYSHAVHGVCITLWEKLLIGRSGMNMTWVQVCVDWFAVTM